MEIKQALEEAYNDLAPYSDKKRWEFCNNYKHLKFFISHISKDSTILDVGCGIGIFIVALKKLGYISR